MNERKRWLVVALYAMAMAWVEAAVVFYLRTLANRIDPYQVNPLPDVAGLSWVELVREAATLVMLLGVGLLAGRDWRSRWGYAAVAFGIWDIFYYLFLRIITHWPHSILDWDILFLIPLPWWGPVLAPVIIAMLMIVWGTLASQFDLEPYRFGSYGRPWLLGFMGMALALYLFMADSLSVASQGRDAVRQVLPKEFAWGWFVIASVMMSAPVLALARKVWRQRMIHSHPTRGTITDTETFQRSVGKNFAQGSSIIE
jgi:hypothetical protein